MEKSSEGIFVLCWLNIGIGLWKIITNLLYSSYFLWTTWVNKGQAVYDATNYAQVTTNEILNFAIGSIIWLGFLIFGFITIKLKDNGRKGLIIVSILAILILFVFPVFRYLFSCGYRQGILIPDPLPILYGINIFYFTRPKVKEQFK